MTTHTDEEIITTTMDDCSICLDKLPKYLAARLVCCGNVLHRQCAEKFTKTSSRCLLCRKPLPQTEKEYFTAIMKHAKNGKAWAQSMVGTAYYGGKGIGQSYSKAHNWFKLSADQEYTEAQYNIGLMYALGKGCQQSYTQARHWYALAAEKDHSVAQLNLGVMYFMGQGGTTSLSTAKELFQKAAVGGEVEGTQYLQLWRL